MALSAGTRLGPYEILAPLGAGGMGEVYRATDTKLGREVAIKVLPTEVARAPERLARFKREATLLAALSHPHIAAIYGLEEDDGNPFLVLELVEGEDLARQLQRGAIPMGEALEVAGQIARGLESAHEKGIVHRDLKPANLKLTPDGEVKILDFGLAKAWAHESVGEPSTEMAPSPTLPDAGTGAGVILGTVAYMSPEQARGSAVDKRADIWAFGVVLFEMLTGRLPFTGQTVSEILVSVMKDEPEWSRLPGDTPAAVRRVLRRCLEKNPKARLRDVGDAVLDLAEASGGDDHLETPSRAGPGREPGLWWMAGAAVIGLSLAIALWAPWRRQSNPPSWRLEARLGSGLCLDPGALSSGPAAILSPDGTRLAFVASKPGEASRIYLRRLEQLDARPLPGTEGAKDPFFSPDGQSIAFFSGGQLRKTTLKGGAPVKLADAVFDVGGSWGMDGTIALAPKSNWLRGSLQRTTSLGGEVQTLTTPDHEAGLLAHRWPQLLGDGRVLYTAHDVPHGFDGASLVIEAFPDGPRMIVYRGGYHGRYVASGHLVFVHQGTLFAAPFDLRKAELTGRPVPVIRDLWANPAYGGAQFSVSDTGTLVYVAAKRDPGAPIHMLHRDGTITTLGVMPAQWYNPRFSPDGDRLAMHLHDGAQFDIWVYEWSRDVLTRLTLDPADDVLPSWMPDGQGVVFASRRGGDGTGSIYWRRSDGSGQAVRLAEGEAFQTPRSVHPSGRYLAFSEPNATSGWDVKMLEINADEGSGLTPGASTPLIDDPFNQTWADFSPDGRFLAYASNESGRLEVYVRQFPGCGGKWQVSAKGGFDPQWSRARPEILFGTVGGEIMVASYTVVGDSFRSERPVPWSQQRFERMGVGASGFALHPDGERIAMRVLGEDSRPGPDSVAIVTNFFDELRRLTSGGEEEAP